APGGPHLAARRGGRARPRPRVERHRRGPERRQEVGGDRRPLPRRSGRRHEGEGGQVVGSATRGALARATSALDATSGVTLATGGQLLAAGGAMESWAQLRAVLADPAVETSRKSTLIGSIFGSLDPVAASLLGGIAESRWSSQAELLDGIEEIGIRAI